MREERKWKPGENWGSPLCPKQLSMFTDMSPAPRRPGTLEVFNKSFVSDPEAEESHLVPLTRVYHWPAQGSGWAGTEVRMRPG